jgi:hypothetical protein
MKVETRAGIKAVHAASEKRLVLQCNIAREVKKSTFASGGGDLPRLDMEARRFSNALEQRRLRRRHPHLSSPLQPSEQGHPALRVEVGGNLVKQNGGRLAVPASNKLRMRENKPDQKRLLLAG